MVQEDNLARVFKQTFIRNLSLLSTRRAPWELNTYGAEHVTEKKNKANLKAPELKNLDCSDYFLTYFFLLLHIFTKPSLIVKCSEKMAALLNGE